MVDIIVSFFLTDVFHKVLESSVETHLRCGEIHNNHIIANCLQSVPVKEF